MTTIDPSVTGNIDGFVNPILLKADYEEYPSVDISGLSWEDHSAAITSSNMRNTSLDGFVVYDHLYYLDIKGLKEGTNASSTYDQLATLNISQHIQDILNGFGFFTDSPYTLRISATMRLTYSSSPNTDAGYSGVVSDKFEVVFTVKGDEVSLSSCQDTLSLYRKDSISSSTSMRAYFVSIDDISVTGGGTKPGQDEGIELE